MSILDIADSLFKDETIKLGVTGLQRSGKTVFITALVENILRKNAARMSALSVIRDGRLIASALGEQPDGRLPRFELEKNMQLLSAEPAIWPANTDRLSQLRLSLRLKGENGFRSQSNPRTVHIDITDYPGEWLLDLSLLDQSFEAWSKGMLDKLQTRPEAQDFLKLLHQTDLIAEHNELIASALAESYTRYLHAMKARGFSDCAPGRFTMPGDYAGSPMLNFVPIPQPEKKWPKHSIGANFAKRFGLYRKEIAKPFFSDHFAKLDRQVVLVDALGALSRGPSAFLETRQMLEVILDNFRPGKSTFLGRLFAGKRVDHLLLAASKADHVHRSQHSNLQKLTECLLHELKDRADFAGAKTRALALASLRCTTESQSGPFVEGLLSDGRAVRSPAIELPDDPRTFIRRLESENMKSVWPEAGFKIGSFMPRQFASSETGMPHLRLDQAAEFLFGDRL